MGIKRVTSYSSAPFLTIMMSSGAHFLKSASITDKLMSILDRMSVKPYGKFGSFLCIKAESLKQLQIVRAAVSATHSQKDRDKVKYSRSSF